QLRPRSVDRRTRALFAAPVPNHTRSAPKTATFVPLAANAPSLGSAAGRRLDATGAQERPPSRVVTMTNAPLTESLTAMPLSASQNVMASKKASALAFANCSVQDSPALVVLKIRESVPLPMLSRYAVFSLTASTSRKSSTLPSRIGFGSVFQVAPP